MIIDCTINGPQERYLLRLIKEAYGKKIEYQGIRSRVEEGKQYLLFWWGVGGGVDCNDNGMNLNERLPSRSFDQGHRTHSIRTN